MYKDISDEVFEEISDTYTNRFDEEIMQSYRKNYNMDSSEAWKELSATKMSMAIIHYFLRAVWQLFAQEMHLYPEEQRKEVIAILNDIRDFLDPFFMVPCYFVSTYTPAENTMREKFLTSRPTFH